MEELLSSLTLPLFALLAALAVAAMAAVAARFLLICQPSEILVISGRRVHRPDGSEVGYRVIFGGRAFRVPILETVERMDRRSIPIEVSVQNAYTKVGIPLKVRAIAVVKISSNPEIVMNVIERFLGRAPGEIQRVAKETLEGNLRGVLATLTPEEVNQDRLKFADSLAHEVEHDLSKLGLHLDVLKIQHVTDDANYLNSMGRERIAQVIRDAEIAESNARNEAAKEKASAEMRAKVADADANTAIVRRRNDQRRIAAELDGQAGSIEERATAGAVAAQAVAEQKLQGVRRDVERLRLDADVVVPADIQREADSLLAAGRAAPIAENGRASAEALQLMADSWAKAGPAAPDMFLLHRIEEITRIVVEAVQRVHLGSVQIVDDASGLALPRLAASYPAAVAAVMRALAESTGIDVPALLSRRSDAAVAGRPVRP